MRINKYTALGLNIARRGADDMIKKGLIFVDGEKATMGSDVKDGQIVSALVDGVSKVLTIQKSAPKILLMYKPIKYVTSNEPEGGHKTIYDILPEKYKQYKFAGRLDVMSEGLLVLSNDGGVVNTLTHPRFGHNKSYIVITEKLLNPRELAQLSAGIEIDGYKTMPTTIKPLMQNPLFYKKYSFLGIHIHQPAYVITLSEGRNQQIRKMMFAVNTKVKRLIRVTFGVYSLDMALMKGKLTELPFKTPATHRNVHAKKSLEIGQKPNPDRKYRPKTGHRFK